MLDCGLLGWDDVFPSDDNNIPSTTTRMAPAAVFVSPNVSPMSLQQQQQQQQNSAPQKHYYHRTAYSASEISTRPVKHSGVAPRSNNNHNHNNNNGSNYYSSMKVVNNNQQQPQQQDPAPTTTEPTNDNNNRGFFDAWSSNTTNYPTLTLPRRTSTTNTEVERIVVVPPDDYVQLQTDRQLLHQQLLKSTQHVQRLAAENQTLKSQLQALREERKRVQDALEGRE